MELCSHSCLAEGNVVSLSAALSQPVERLLPGPASPFTLLTFCHRCVKSPLSRLPPPPPPPPHPPSDFRQSQYGLGLTVVRRLPLHHHHYHHHHHHQRASGALIPRAHLSVCSSLPDGVCACVTYLPELSASSPYLGQASGAGVSSLSQSVSRLSVQFSLVRAPASVWNPQLLREGEGVISGVGAVSSCLEESKEREEEEGKEKKKCCHGVISAL